MFVFLYIVVFSLGSGDRTPKQKVKLRVTEEKLLNLMLKYNGGKPRTEVLLCLLGVIWLYTLPLAYLLLNFSCSCFLMLADET